MSNPRDTGRYDQFTDTWSGDEVRVDFAWGNIPMQPDDDRGEDTLDPALDSHIIATMQYEGFPAFTTGAPFDDLKPNITMPNLTGVLPSAIRGILNSYGGTGEWGIVGTSEVGATSQNNGKVKSQDPVAGTIVNYDQDVDVITYNYVVSATTGPIAGFNRNPSTGSLNGNEAWMYLVGRTVRPAVGDSIAVTGSSDTEHNITWTVLEVINDDGYNTGGTAVKVHCLIAPLSDTSSGGTWTKL